MVFGEFLNEPNFKPLFTDYLTNLYPNTMLYLTNRYFNYELKYEPMSFYKFGLSLFMKFGGMLKDIENAITIRQNKAFSEENLGKVRKTIGTDNSTQESKFNEGYSGYNVEEESFRTDSSNSTNSRNNTYTTTDINLMYALRTLEQSGKAYSWDKFEKQFSKLFITLYELYI